jgi:hypothetical protein
VYVGGSFTNAGGVSGANRIARWNIASSTWNLVGAANASAPPGDDGDSATAIMPEAFACVGVNEQSR